MNISTKDLGEQCMALIHIIESHKLAIDNLGPGSVSENTATFIIAYHNDCLNRCYQSLINTSKGLVALLESKKVQEDTVVVEVVQSVDREPNVEKVETMGSPFN